MVPAGVRELFMSSFGSGPEIIASAPGRVNLIGEHTDYNGGEVLPIAIENRTRVAMRRRTEATKSRAVSADEGDTGEFAYPHPGRSGRWWDYVSGFAAQSASILPAIDVAVMSDVPVGAGLSSSAALEVAAGCAYAALSAHPHSMRDIALEAWRVETQFVGVACGIMDQFAAAMSRQGHALHVWCDSLETERIPFSSTVLIFDTAVPRSLRLSEFNVRQAECGEALKLLRKEDPALENLAAATPEQVRAAGLPRNLENRALHVTEETRRVKLAAKQLRATGTINGSLLYDSHASLRDRYQCSSPELDWFVDRAMRTRGIEGARLTGAGWGGCAIALGNREALAAAGDEIAVEYQRRFKHPPRVWLTEASAGAGIEAGQ